MITDVQLKYHLQTLAYYFLIQYFQMQLSKPEHHHIQKISHTHLLNMFLTCAVGRPIQLVTALIMLACSQEERANHKHYYCYPSFFGLGLFRQIVKFVFLIVLSICAYSLVHLPPVQTSLPTCIIFPLACH